MAREAMTLGPRIEALKVLKEVIKAGAVASIVAAVGRRSATIVARPALRLRITIRIGRAPGRAAAFPATQPDALCAELLFSAAAFLLPRRHVLLLLYLMLLVLHETPAAADEALAEQDEEAELQQREADQGVLAGRLSAEGNAPPLRGEVVALGTAAAQHALVPFAARRIESAQARLAVLTFPRPRLVGRLVA